MAVKLRLRRMGKKKQPIYKVVAADARSPRDGRFLEMIGMYNPLTKPHTVDLKEDRVLYWLNNGAQPTQTVKSLLRQKGIILKNELTKRGVAEDKIESELAEWSKLKEASQKVVQKKKISRKAKAKVEASDESAKAETASIENSEKQKEADAEKSTTEVTGAASDEKEAKKE